MVRDTGGEIFHNSKYQKIKTNQKIVEWYDDQFLKLYQIQFCTYLMN